MKTVLTLVLKSISAQLSMILLKFFSTVSEVFKYLTFCKKEKKEKEQREQIKQYNDKVKDAVDNGTVEDLLNL